MNKKDLTQYYGIKLKDKTELMKSQSGGAFFAIAKVFIMNMCAAVYGCGMNDENEAIYLRVETIEGINLLHGSKYVQARLENVYEQIKKDLDSGRVVLFSGTPCYVGSINKYFLNHKNYSLLYSVDIICHGVPSPLVYKKYMEYIESMYSKKIKKFIFRDKQKEGWHRHVEKIIFQDDDTLYCDGYTQLFYTNLPLRESCGNCKYSSMNRVGDFTIGDYWGIKGINPGFHDDLGVSLLFCNNKRANELFSFIEKEIDYFVSSREGVMLQQNLKDSSYIPKCKKMFWNDFHKKGISYCIKKWSPKGGITFKIKKKIFKMIGIW